MESYKIELEHIRLELIHRRTKNVNVINHLRHFVDQWFCYKHGYITNGNRAAWGKIIFKEYILIYLTELYSLNLIIASNKAHLI